MRLLKPLGLALVAALALAAALSASAFGLELPENLPASTTRTWTGKNLGNLELHIEGQGPIECTEASSEGTEETSKPPKGRFHISFKNCKTNTGIVVKCTGLGQMVAGTILLLGTWSLVFDKLIGKPFENLTTAVRFINEAVHFTCGGLVLVEVLENGETLCLHLNPQKSIMTHEFHCLGQTAGGVPKPIEEWGKDVGGVFSAAATPRLQASVNHAAAVPALQLGLGTVTYTENVFADQ